jgi:parvulin-like peptidyl-prolyl isomerase
MKRLFHASCVAILCLSACKPSRQSTGNNPQPPQDAVAWVGDDPVTREDFQAELDRHYRRVPGARGGPAARERLLDEMLRRKVMVARAREAGFDRDPEMLRLVERLIADRYQEKLAAERLNADPVVTDEQVAAFHRQHQHRYQVPGALRAGVIWIKASPRAEPQKKAEARVRAEAIRLEAARSDAAGFSELARKHSDDQATRYNGGDTGWIRDGLDLPDDLTAVREAAEALASPGEVAPLVESADGFRIVRLGDRQAPSVRPLEEVRVAIRHELLQVARQTREDEFFNDLKSGLEVGINRPLLQSIPVPAAPDLTRVPPPMPRDSNKK